MVSRLTFIDKRTFTPASTVDVNFEICTVLGQPVDNHRSKYCKLGYDNGTNWYSTMIVALFYYESNISITDMLSDVRLDQLVFADSEDSEHIAYLKDFAAVLTHLHDHYSVSFNGKVLK